MNSSVVFEKRYLHRKKIRRKFTKMLIVVMSNFYLLLHIFCIFQRFNDECVLFV